MRVLKIVLLIIAVSVFFYIYYYNGGGHCADGMAEFLFQRKAED